MSAPIELAKGPVDGPDRRSSGWRFARTTDGSEPSLSEVHASITVPKAGFWLRRLLAFSGPGYMVSVGYMDPGNWATDIAGGSKFGYTLLSVIMLSNLMAILLQALAARLGIASRPRPGAGLPRRLSAAGGDRAVGCLRIGDHRLRSRRGDRHGDRAQAFVRHSA